MKISIITVCYNSAATLETAIESVLGQTYQDIEYIVVDGGSTDGTVEMLRRYAAGKCGNAWNKHAPRTSTLVQSPNARLRPAELERGAVFRDGAAMRECANENADACLENQIRQSGTKALRQFLWISEPDEGMYDAINKGIRMATGDVVGILNADDVLSADDVIERVAQVFGGSAS
ncbi:MAG: glycosyltransferase, partial [bacterium]